MSKMLTLMCLCLAPMWALSQTHDLTLPWAANQAQFRSTLVINNTGPNQVTTTLTAQRMAGATDPDHQTISLEIPALSQVVSDVGELFPLLGDGPGFAIRISSDADHIKAALVLNGTGSSSGSSPAQINAAAADQAGQKLTFPYLPSGSGNISAPVLFNPSPDQMAQATLHAWRDGRPEASAEIEIAPEHPHAATVDTLFPGLEGNLMISVQSDLPLLGSAFIFNDQLEPSMAEAVVVDELPDTSIEPPFTGIRATAVTTITEASPLYNDSLAFDSQGRLSISDFTGGDSGDAGRLTDRRHFRVHPVANGRRITLLDLETGETATKTIAARTPLGQAYDSQGNLFVAAFFGPNVYKVTPDGQASPILPIANGPISVAVDSHDNVYVSLLAEPDQRLFDNEHIVKVTPSGEITTFIESHRLRFAVGMVFDEHDNLYVGNHYGGNIMKIDPAGNLEVFASVNGPYDYSLGYITYAHGHIFATAYGLHQVYMFDSEGNRTLLAGSSEPGHQDGDPLTAMFDEPNGIAISPDGKSLYISEAGNLVIRRIDLEINL